MSEQGSEQESLADDDGQSNATGGHEKAIPVTGNGGGGGNRTRVPESLRNKYLRV